MNAHPIGCLIATLAALVLPAASAHAHARLDHASPAVGSVGPGPESVTLWFTESLEPAFSTIEVQNAQGAAVQSGKASVNPDDRRQLRVSLKALPPGTYKVIWRVLSVDTHRTQGDFTFSVGR
jgi:hypothetical protein